MTPIIKAYLVLACDRQKKSGSFFVERSLHGMVLAKGWDIMGEAEILVGMQDKAPISIQKQR